MKIKNFKFKKSLTKYDKLENSTNLPEIAIVGRSNVGKSSFINMLAGNKKLAKTSSVPGKTRLINLFSVNDEFYLVDLPGYGFAKVSDKEQNSWAVMIEDYLKSSENLKAVIMLVDIRHKPSVKDEQMLEFIVHYNLPVIFVATKFDKIKKSEKEKCLSQIAQTLKTGIGNIIVTSAQTGYGKSKVEEKLLQILESTN